MEKEKTAEKRNSVQQILYQMVQPALIVMQLVGYLPHPISKHYEVTNNFCSVPFIWSFFVLLVLLNGAIQLYGQQATFIKFGDAFAVPTEKFCRLMIVWTLMLSTCGFAMKAFLCKKATKEFWSMNYFKLQELGRVDQQFDLESERFQALKRVIARSNFIWTALAVSVSVAMVGVGVMEAAIVIAARMTLNRSLNISHSNHTTFEAYSQQPDTQSGSILPIATVTAFVVAHLYITIPVYMTFFLQVYGACLENIVSYLREGPSQFPNDRPCLTKVDSLSRCPPDELAKKVKDCIRAYYIIKDLVDAFSRYFAFEITVIVVASLLTILTSAFFAIYHGFNGIIHIGWVSLLVPLIRIGIYVAHLYVMASACTSLTKQADQLREQLIRINLDVVSVSMQTKIQLIANDIAMKPPIVTPGFFFVFDRKLLVSMLSCITTYLVILIQFRYTQF